MVIGMGGKSYRGLGLKGESFLKRFGLVVKLFGPLGGNDFDVGFPSFKGKNRFKGGGP